MTTREVSDWQLERYRLGELEGAESAHVEAELCRDRATHERLERLRADDERILREHPPRAVGAALRERLSAADRPRTPPRQGRALAAWLGTAAAVLVAATLLVGRVPRPATRLKGLEPGLLVFRQGTQGADRLAPGAYVRAADVVQVAYQAAGKRYGVIVSLDGRGRVTRHLPRAGAEAAALRSGAPVPLPDAYRLDDAPAFERFFFVTSEAPFAVEDVARAARRLGSSAASSPLALPSGLGQSSFELRKEEP